jgi:drug/metabolite transporter (DMT)-like permease
MTQNDTRRGVWLRIATTVIFAMQDGLSRHLADVTNAPMVVMVRYWFFAAFVLAIARRQKGSIRAAAATSQPLVQAFRGALLALEIMVMVVAFVYLGLVESHAVFAAYPLLVGALSGPVLGEHVGWRRWTAIGIGFIGVLIILQPGAGVFSPYSVIPLVASLMFALYSLLSRYVARKDDAATSFFWTGTVGAVVSTAVGVFFGNRWRVGTGR